MSILGATGPFLAYTLVVYDLAEAVDIEFLGPCVISFKVGPTHITKGLTSAKASLPQKGHDGVLPVIISSPLKR